MNPKKRIATVVVFILGAIVSLYISYLGTMSDNDFMEIPFMFVGCYCIVFSFMFGTKRLP